jgi:hypothetical protein
MYNKKDVQFVGKHDFDKESAERFASWGGNSFSVNIFKWGLKSNGKEMKPLKGVVRVHGCPNNKDVVFATCEKIIADLDNGKYDGKKNIIIKSPF